MSPILESIGSVKGFGWGAFSLPNSYESIMTASGSGSSGVITFNSIPQTYTHLQIRSIAMRSGAGTSTDYVGIRVNGNTSSIYTNHWAYVSNSTMTIQSDNTNTHMYGNRGLGGTQFSSNDVGVMIIDIHDYTSTSKKKTFYMHSGWAPNSAGNMYCQLGSGMPLLDDAITSISFNNFNDSFTTSTDFALYGIKGA